MVVLGCLVGLTLELGSVPVLSAQKSLVLDLEKNQQFFQVEATTPDAIAYARAFAQGQAAPLTRAHCPLHNPTTKEQILCSAGTRIVRIQDCRADGHCTPVPGLYSGRSPD